MSEDFYERADSIQVEAQSFLEKSTISKILELYGQVNLYGSFAFGTMCSREIDILLKIDTNLTNDKRDIVQEITEKLFKLKQEIIDIHFIDCFNFKIKKNLPKGFYLGFDIADNSIVETWHFDIWLLSTEDFLKNMAFVKTVKELMTPELKRIIMATKNALTKRNEKVNLSVSYKIYQAVLIEKLRNEEEIFSFIGKS